MNFLNTVFPLYLFLFFTERGVAQKPLPPIGQWRDHLPYKSAVDVTAGNGKIFCATPYSIFSVDVSTNMVERKSRLNGLSETGVNAICYDALHDKLLIVYRNSNMDVIFRQDVFNVPDLKRKITNQDKTIYNIFPFQNKFYLSTGLGILVLGSEKYEIEATWQIGNNGEPVKINGFTADSSFYYAATSQGLKKTLMHPTNPANYLNWQNLSGANGLSYGACDDVVAAQGKIIVLKNDSLFMRSGTTWNLFFTQTEWHIRRINVSSGKIILCQQKNDGSARVILLNTDGTTAQILQQPAQITIPKNALLTGADVWVADSIAGLTKFMTSGLENYQLNSPQSVAAGDMVVHKGVLIASAGEVNSAWQKQNNKNGIYKYDGGQWTNYNHTQFPLLDSLADFISVAVDPRDESLWAGSFGGGLLHIKDGHGMEVFKQNSPLGQAIYDPGSYRVAGLVFDHQNNLWMANYGALANIIVRKADGNWKSFTPPFSLYENAVSQIVVDDEDQKWIVSPNGNGLLCFNDNHTPDHTADDRWKIYRSGSGNGNLPSNHVLCIAKDKNGFIWVGTADGIGIIQCPQSVFSAQGCAALLPVVQQGGFNQYLFKGEEVITIAIDGADRKWIGTRNGVWLLSSSGEQIIEHFTQDNSPLLSNEIKKIAIDGKTGEVFFATANGICSYRGTATEGKTSMDEVLVFPNPVPPGFTGTIAIRGVPANAIVKITEPDGRLVYQTRALGGQAIWNGRDYQGKKISSGVYLVLVSDDTRKENLATKIVFIAQ